MCYLFVYSQRMKSFKLHDPEGNGNLIALILFGFVFVASFAAIVAVLGANV